jgi:hypothetical protein
MYIYFKIFNICLIYNKQQLHIQLFDMYKISDACIKLL